MFLEDYGRSRICRLYVFVLFACACCGVLLSGNIMLALEKLCSLSLAHQHEVLLSTVCLQSPYLSLQGTLRQGPGGQEGSCCWSRKRSGQEGGEEGRQEGGQKIRSETRSEAGEEEKVKDQPSFVRGGIKRHLSSLVYVGLCGK